MKAAMVQRGFDEVNGERTVTSPHGGWVEVICGGMFAGKTEELERRITRALIARQKVQVFKSAADTRYADNAIVTHEGRERDCTPIGAAEDLLGSVDERTAVVCVDEAQFLDDGIVRVVEELANRGHRVIVAGLDQDFASRPFGPVPGLMAIAEYVTKLHAVCGRCGGMASKSLRTAPGEETVKLGAKNNYEPLCRKCYSAAYGGADG